MSRLIRRPARGDAFEVIDANRRGWMRIVEHRMQRIGGQRTGIIAVKTDQCRYQGLVVAIGMGEFIGFEFMFT